MTKEMKLKLFSLIREVLELVEKNKKLENEVRIYKDLLNKEMEKQYEF